MSGRIFPIAVAAFVLPLVVVLFLRRDELQEMLKIDPQTAPGHVLYFTSPT